MHGIHVSLNKLANNPCDGLAEAGNSSMPHMKSKDSNRKHEENKPKVCLFYEGTLSVPKQGVSQIPT
jgi:hypothetical protein